MRSPSAFLQNAAGIAALCAMDAAMKHVVQTEPVGFATFGRYVAGTLFAAGVWLAAGRPPITRDALRPLALRGVLVACCAVLFFYAIKQLPLAETIVITFMAPLLVPPLAAVFLGERLQARFVIAGLVAFGGVLLTIQGAPVLDHHRALGLAAALGAALTYAGGLIVLRARAGRDGATVMTLAGAFVPMLLLSPTAIGQQWPAWESLGWILVVGALGNLGVQLMARAYRHAEAQALAVLEFTALPWAALFGWMAFAEPVRPQVWAGGAIIAGACLWASRVDSRRGDALVEEPIGA